MRLLLDTHVWLWWTGTSKRLSKKAFRLIADPANQIVFSIVSVWEISIKYQLGKIQLPLPPSMYIPARLGKQRFETLPIALPHALEAASLPEHHRDPFDRLLVAQAQIEGLTLLTADAALAPYSVKKVLL